MRREPITVCAGCGLPKVKGAPCQTCPTLAAERIPARRCEIDGCNRPVKARGLCDPCYLRWRRGTLDADAQTEPRPQSKPCTVDGCDRGAHGRGLCTTHYRQARHEAAAAGDAPVCDIDGCGGPLEARGLCGRHYQQWRAGRLDHPAAPPPPREAGPPRLCGVEGCDRPRARAGLCWTHRYRRRNGLPMDAPIAANRRTTWGSPARHDWDAIAARAAAVPYPCLAEPDAWHPETRADAVQAAALCAGCAIARQCAQAADGARWGVWAGRIHDEREEAASA